MVTSSPRQLSRPIWANRTWWSKNYEDKEDTLMLKKVLRSTRAIALIAGLDNLAVAQYGGGGGGGGMPGSPTYNPHSSYSNKGAIIGGTAGGAAAVGGLLYWRHHNRAKLVGCV